MCLQEFCEFEKIVAKLIFKVVFAYVFRCFFLWQEVPVLIALRGEVAQLPLAKMDAGGRLMGGGLPRGAALKDNYD